MTFFQYLAPLNMEPVDIKMLKFHNKHKILERIQIVDIIYLFIFAVEYEVLEREVGRLRNLYQQQQQQPQQQPISSSHRRANSRDLDKQFANLSMKPKEAAGGTNRDNISGQLHM